MSMKHRLEAAVKQLQEFSDDLDKKDSMSGEDITELKRRMEDVKSLREAYQADADVKGQVSEAKSFLASLAGPEDGKAKDVVKVSTEWGAPMDPQGKTFGELFTESEGYSEFIGRYSKNGVIPNAAKGIQSSPFQIDAKALITGTSSTSGGAFVVNDRLPRCPPPTTRRLLLRAISLSLRWRSRSCRPQSRPSRTGFRSRSGPLLTRHRFGLWSTTSSGTA